MGCKNCSENSSTTYSRCNPPLSSNCTFYQGDSLECVNDTTFSICKGDSLTSVQTKIFNKICKIIGKTDVSKVLIPTCLQEAWDNKDLTILNLFNLSLDNACYLQDQITNIVKPNGLLDNVNPTVLIKNVGLGYADCCDGCTVEVSLTTALNNIITEICNLKNVTKNLQLQYSILLEDLNVVKSNYEAFNTFMSNQTVLNVSLQQDIVSLKSKTNCLDDCP